MQIRLENILLVYWPVLVSFFFFFLVLKSFKKIAYLYMNYIRPCMIKPNIVINVKLNKWAILYFKHFTNMNQKSEEDALAVSVIWSGGKISFPDLKAFHIRVHVIFCYVILQHWSSYLLCYTIHCNRDHFSPQIPRIIFRPSLISKCCILPRIVYSNYGCIF